MLGRNYQRWRKHSKECGNHINHPTRLGTAFGRPDPNSLSLGCTVFNPHACGLSVAGAVSSHRFQRVLTFPCSVCFPHHQHGWGLPLLMTAPLYWYKVRRLNPHASWNPKHIKNSANFQGGITTYLSHLAPVETYLYPWRRTYHQVTAGVKPPQVKIKGSSV